MPNTTNSNELPVFSNQPSSAGPSPVPPVMNNKQGGVKNFILNYKWYILGGLGVASIISLAGVLSYQWYFKPIAKLSEQKNVNQVVDSGLVTEQSTTENTAVVDESGQTVDGNAVGDNSTSSVLPSNNAVGGDSSANSSSGNGAVAPVGGNNGGGVVAPAGGNGGGGVVVPADGGNGANAGAVADPIPGNGGNAEVVVPQVNVGQNQVVPSNQNVVVQNQTEVGGSASANVLPNEAGLVNLQAQALINIVADATSPASSITKDESKTKLVVLKITATNNPTKINSLTFHFSSPDAYKLAGSLSLTSGNANPVLVSIQSAGPQANGKFVFSNLNLDVKKDVPVLVTVALEMGVLANEGLSGVNTGVVFDSADYTYNSKSYKYTMAVDSKSTYVFKSYPQFSLLALPSRNLIKGINTLSSFRISPIGGTVGWKVLTFDLSGKIKGFKIGANQASAVLGYNGLYNLLLKGGPGVAMGENEDIDQLATDLKVYRSGVAGILTEVAGTVTYVHRMNRAEVIFKANAEQRISSVTSYVLKGNVLKNDSSTLYSGDNINSSLMGKGLTKTCIMSDDLSAFSGPSNIFSVVWSDLSAVAHSDNSKDWHAECLLPGIPSAVQTITYTAPIVVPDTVLPLNNVIQAVKPTL